MRTVLMITRSFPPMFSTGGKRAYRFARYLPQYGWRPIVVTSPIPDDRAKDHTAGLALDPSVVIEHSFTPGWWPRNKGGASSDGTVAKPTKAKTYPPEGRLANLLWQFDVPIGTESIFMARWALQARLLARKYKPDVIFATSGPYTALLFGAVANAVTGIPMLLDLRDPWSLNFGQLQKPPWIRTADRWLEERILKRAAKVTFTCEPVVDAYRRSFKDIDPERLTCIYNSFDPEQAPTNGHAVARSETVRLVHFGNCYWGRSLTTVIEAVGLLKRQGELAPGALEVLNLGRMAQEDFDLMDQLDVRAFFEHKTFVPYAEGLEILSSADALLLLACGDETLFVAGKLFDYFLVGRPILCVSQPCDQTRLVLETQSGVVVTPGDTEAAANALRRLIAARKGGEPLAAYNREAVARFSSAQTTRQLAGLLDDIVDKTQDGRGKRT